jgi:hypothetical protein
MFKMFSFDILKPPFRWYTMMQAPKAQVFLLTEKLFEYEAVPGAAAA